jgi:hypothetical protein
MKTLTTVQLSTIYGALKKFIGIIALLAFFSACAADEVEIKEAQAPGTSRGTVTTVQQAT